MSVSGSNAFPVGDLDQAWTNSDLSRKKGAWKRVTGAYLTFFCASLLTTLPWLSNIGGWLDEGATMSAARRPAIEILRLSWNHDAVLSAYYLTVHYWMSIFGDSLTSARILSALCLAAATVTIVDCGRIIGGLPVGCLAGMQMLFIPGVSWCGLDARPTAVATLLLSMALRVLLKARSQNPPMTFYALVIASSWIQLTSIIQVFTVVTRKNIRSLRIWMAIVASCICVCMLAWLGQRQSAQISWIKGGPFLQVLSAVAGRFADSPRSTTEYVGTAAVSGALLGIVFFVSSVVSFFIVRTETSRRLVTWAFAPALLAVLIGTFTGGSVYLPRYFAATLPAAFLLVALGARQVWARSRGGWKKASCLVVAASIIGLCVPSLAASRVANGKWGENSKALALEIRDSAKPVIWSGNSISVSLTYPRLIGEVDQYPNPTLAYDSGSLWGKTPSTQFVAETARYLGVANVVVERQHRIEVEQQLYRAGCRAVGSNDYRRYVLLLISC